MGFRRGAGRKALWVTFATSLALLGLLVGGAQVLAAGDPEVGRALFTGEQRLQNGGPPCISCHSVEGIGALGGGSMGKDLTKAYSSFGEQGLTTIMKNPPFQVMRDIFPQKPITDEEIQNLLAFFQQVDQAATGAQASWAIFPVIGIAGFIVLLLIFQGVWAGRTSRGVGVRKQIVYGR